MSTGLSDYQTDFVQSLADSVRERIHALLEDEGFNVSITFGTDQTTEYRHDS